jgi:hypothetical protein
MYGHYETQKGWYITCLGCFWSRGGPGAGVWAREDVFPEPVWLAGTWAIFPTFSEDWGLQVQWRRHFMSMILDITWVTSVQNAELLLLWRLWGRLNLGMISWIWTLTTSWAFSVEQRQALTHHVKVSTSTRSSRSEDYLPCGWNQFSSPLWGRSLVFESLQREGVGCESY